MPGHAAARGKRVKGIEPSFLITAPENWSIPGKTTSMNVVGRRRML